MAAPGLLVVEDDDFTRATLVAALERYGIAVQTAVGSAREALALESLPDAALLDLDLGPGPSGIDLAHELRRREPRIGIILLTSYSDPRLLSRDLPPAPRGTRCLAKREVGDMGQVVAAVHAVRRVPFESTSTARVGLSDALLDVLQAVAQGLSTREIAYRRDVSEKAVEAAITRLCEYFGLQREDSRNQRVRLAAEYYCLIGRPPQ